MRTSTSLRSSNMEFVLFIGAFWLIVFLFKHGSSLLPDAERQPFEIRMLDTTVELKGGHSVSAKVIQAKGPFPVTSSTAMLSAQFSVMDKLTESGTMAPVFCVIEKFQEKDSLNYFDESDFGIVSSNQHLPNWARIGVVYPEIMRPPYSGERNLTVVVKIVDAMAKTLVMQKDFHFTHQFKEKGYLEAAAHRAEAQILTLKIAMAVAMADGNLDAKEGGLMQKWIKRSLLHLSGEHEEHMKASFNQALRESNKQAKEGTLRLSALAKRLNEIGETGDKYQAMELSADIMAADDLAHADEIKVLNHLAEVLELDMKRVGQILDSRIIKVSSTGAEGEGAEAVLGIKPGWSKAKIKKHLIAEFSKWNNRLNTLPPGKQRDSAQRMLDTIAELRKKHG